MSVKSKNVLPVNDYPKYLFRAKLSEVDGGGFIDGYIIYRYGRTYLESEITHELYEVEEKNVRQLVGYVKAGSGFCKVFEGDAIDVGEGTCYATVLKYDMTEPGRSIQFTQHAEKYGWKLADKK